MKTEAFIQQMNDLQINISAADSTLYPREYLEKTSNQFKFRFKKASEFSNSALRVVAEYDCSKVEIGMVTFNAIVEEDDDFFYFGRFDADEFAINKKSAEVVLRELGADHTLYDCAQTGALFLDALYLAAHFLSTFPLGADITENQADVCAKAIECGMAAGGERYVDFYKVMLGCES